MNEKPKRPDIETIMDSPPHLSILYKAHNEYILYLEQKIERQNELIDDLEDMILGIIERAEDTVEMIIDYKENEK